MNRTIRLFSLIFCVLTYSNYMNASKQPNVLFIFTDDQRPDAFGAVGNTDINTPNMDRIFRDGFVFKQAYIQGSMTNATCLPSRAMIMSGKSLFRAPLRLDSGILLPQALQKGGYHTFATGKWHNGALSFEKSFDEAEAVFLGGAARSHIGVPVNRMIAGLMVPYDSGDSFSTELFADAAIEFIESRQKSDEPFFCYVPFTAPHSPVTPPGKWANMYNPENITLPPNHSALRPDLVDERPGIGRSGGFGRSRRGGGDGDESPIDRAKKQLALYYGLVSHLDHHIGRVIHALDRTGQIDDTIILFATDHGMAMDSHGQNGKHNAFEHTSRVQMVFSGSKIPKGESDALVYLYDIYPTLCGLTGLPVPEGVEGKSLSGIINGKDEKVREYLFTAYMDDQRAIRDDRWKLFYRPKSDRVAFYDLKNDPHELNDLAQSVKHSKRIGLLKQALSKARLEYGDTAEATTKLMQSRGGRFGGRSGGRSGGRPGGIADAAALVLAKRVAESFLNHSKSTLELSKQDFESNWISLFSDWKGGEPSAGRRQLIAGFAKLIGGKEIDSPSTLAARQRGAANALGNPSSDYAVVARAFSYAVDSDDDREITVSEIKDAVKKWSASGDKNNNGQLNVVEITTIVEGFFKSLSASGPRRRNGR